MSELHVSHQNININIDSETLHISGYTELEIECEPSSSPDVIFLNARQLNIKSIFLNDSPTEFQYIDTHKALEFTGTPLVRDAAQFTSVCEIVLQSPEVIIPVNQNFPLVVRIDFDVNDDSTAIVKKDEVIFTDNKIDGPMSWFPCMGESSQRSSFKLNIT